MGAIQDITSTFTIPFIISGSSFLACAILHFMVMWLVHQETVCLRRWNTEGTVGGKTTST